MYKILIVIYCGDTLSTQVISYDEYAIAELACIKLEEVYSCNIYKLYEF